MMRVARAAVLVSMLAACAAQSGERAAMNQGRTYTDWLFERQYDQLWERFSPEMQKTFASPKDLASFAEKSMADLGTPTGPAAEHIATIGAMQVYSRTGRFDRAPRAVEVQWTMGADGRVTGLLVHPVPGDSAAADPGPVDSMPGH